MPSRGRPVTRKAFFNAFNRKFWPAFGLFAWSLRHAIGSTEPSSDCIFGKIVAGVCQCDPGFVGPTCDHCGGRGRWDCPSPFQDLGFFYPRCICADGRRRLVMVTLVTQWQFFFVYKSLSYIRRPFTMGKAPTCFETTMCLIGPLGEEISALKHHKHCTLQLTWQLQLCLYSCPGKQANKNTSKAMGDLCNHWKSAVHGQMRKYSWRQVIDSITNWKGIKNKTSSPGGDDIHWFTLSRKKNN